MAVLGLRMAPDRLTVGNARQLDLDRALRWLPGVHPSSARDRLVVDTRVASLYPLEVFHLFGYRKIQQEGARLIVARRPGEARDAAIQMDGVQAPNYLADDRYGAALLPDNRSDLHQQVSRILSVASSGC